MKELHRFLAAALFAAVLVPVLAAPAEYSVVIQNQVAGHLRVEAAADGSLRTDFSFRDNGRGPDVRERFTLGALGAPVTYEGEGQSTFGAAIRERFAFDAGRVNWTSRIDQGDEAAEPGALFLPLEGTLAYGAELVRSLLQRPDRSAPVVGGHRLVAERIATQTIEGPGGPVALALVALTGADSNPWYYWLRDDGTNRLFAVTWPGWATIAKGHEGAVDALVKRQLQAQEERLAALRQRLAQPLPGLTLIRAVRWFDAKAARRRGPSDVYVFGGRIAAVVEPGRFDAKPDQVIDGAGRTLLPGLFDAHAHLWPEAALMHLAAGVTAVRDMAARNDALLRLKARIDSGEVAGPKVQPAGFIEGRSPFSSRNGFVVASVEEGLRAVDWYAARGYRQIKLYNSIKPEWVKPLAARAKGHGMTVAGHVPAFMRAEDAVRAGYDEITHINQVMLNFVVKAGDDTRTLTRFTRIGDDAHRLDLTSREARAFLRLLRERGTAVDPTLNAFDAMYRQAQGEPNPLLAAVADRLPVGWRRGQKVAEMDLEGQKLTTYRASYRRLLDLTRAMHRAGVPLVAGTDSVPGLGLHRELELLVEAGIPAAEALRIGTWNGARIAGLGDRIGSIERGKDADLVLIDGDPSRNIADIRRTSLVIQGGTAWAPARIFEALGFRPGVDAARIEVTRSGG